MPLTQFSTNAATPLELPAEGFPTSEDSLRRWFREKYARDATEREVGALMAAMAARDSKPRPGEPRVEPGGWRVDLQGPTEQK